MMFAHVMVAMWVPTSDSAPAFNIEVLSPDLNDFHLEQQLHKVVSVALEPSEAQGAVENSVFHCSTKSSILQLVQLERSTF